MTSLQNMVFIETTRQKVLNWKSYNNFRNQDFSWVRICWATYRLLPTDGSNNLLNNGFIWIVSFSMLIIFYTMKFFLLKIWIISLLKRPSFRRRRRWSLRDCRLFLAHGQWESSIFLWVMLWFIIVGIILKKQAG